MKRIITVFSSIILSMGLMVGCAPSNTSETTGGTTEAPTQTTTEAPSFDTSKEIVVISREDGSGTRGAFIDLFGIEEKTADGGKKDLTTEEAIIAKQTDIMMTSVAGDDYAIGYISLGSLNDTVKAVQIDGADATAENVKNGSYIASRPFNIATKGEPSGLTKDFIDFILSSEGQAIVGDSYISINDAATAYAGDKPSGKLVIAGSSSVSPLMEKLIEGYKAINTNAEIELQTNDSSAGMQGAIDGTCDIGMASRSLKDSEAAELKSLEIAKDGIAVIVNKNNTTTTLSKDQVKNIFTGATLNWSELG